MATVSRVGKWRRTILVSSSAAAAAAAAMAPIRRRLRCSIQSLRRKSPQLTSLQLPFFLRRLLRSLRSPLPLSPQPPSPLSPVLRRRTLQVPSNPSHHPEMPFQLNSYLLCFYRVDDLCTRGLERCYFLDFLGPRGFAVEFARRASCEVIAFDHRKSVLSEVPSEEDCLDNLTFRLNTEKSSAFAVYDYFSAKLADIEFRNGMDATLLEVEERDRVELVLKYIEDGDLRRWSLPDIRAFNIGLGEWCSKLNCFTNPYMYEQLLEISATDVIAKGKSYISARQKAANKLLDKPLKIRLGRGFYGECLGMRADGNSELSDEIGKQLSVKSAAAGLRPIGAVIFMQRRNLKMCLRSTDTATDTSEVAKAYGGGGTPSSSSFNIRMDEYNQWVSGNSR